MILGHVSLLLRWSRPRPLGLQVAVVDGSVGSRSITGVISTPKVTRKRKFVHGRALRSSTPGFSSSAYDGVFVDGLPSLGEYIATLGAFFTLPEQGITSPEILSRCSATPVRFTPSSPLRFLASAHAVMPWAFPGYNDQAHDWLKFLDGSNVRYYAELRDPLTGSVLSQYEVINLAKHPSRDVAALGLKGEGGRGDGDRDEESVVLDDIRSKGIPFSPLSLRRRLMDQSDTLHIVGYEVREQPGELGQGGDPGMVMVRGKGELAARTTKQAFVSTNHATLKPGMCGAAVLDSDMALCGCVEGVVPTAPPEAEVEANVRALQGMPCVVEWEDLSTLLMATMGGGVDNDDSADDDK